MLIDDERLETALKRLAKSDALVAELHMKAERAEYRARAVKDALFLRAEADLSVAAKTAWAGTHAEYDASMNDYFAALQAFETLKNERSREVLVIDVWRSLNSAKSKGMIT